MRNNKNAAIVFILALLTLLLSACTNPLAKDGTKTDTQKNTEKTQENEKQGDEENKKTDDKDNEISCPLFDTTEACKDGGEWKLVKNEVGCEVPVCKDGEKAKEINKDEEEKDQKKEESKNEENEKKDNIDKTDKVDKNEGVGRAKKEKMPAPKAQTEKTMIILDASGSMWGQIDGTPKMDIAKEVLQTTVKQFDGKSELGLMVYGHREKGKCEDIEILTEPKANNSEAISNFVSGITPKGMTPMGASVLMAAENLKYTEDKATVILISDGIETCDVDLCALGKKLEETGVDFTAHVIGFDMTEEQTAGLKCLAAETGGQFMTAKDASSLSDAIEKAVEASACSAEKLGDVRLTTAPTVAAGSTFEVEYVSNGETSDDDWIAVVPQGSENTNDNLDYFRIRNESELVAPEQIGDFDIVYVAQCGAILGRSTFTVTGVTANISKINDVTAGSEFDIEFTGPDNRGDWIAVVPKDSSERNEHLDYFYTSNTSGLRAPEDIGEYDVVYFTAEDNVLARRTFNVTPVSANIAELKPVPAGSAFEVEFTGTGNSGDWITILPKGSEDRNDHLDYFYTGNRASLTAPEEAGEYDIIYFTREDKVLDKTSLSVTPVTASISPIGTVNAGEDFDVDFTGPNNSGDWICILPKGSIDNNDHLDYFYAGNRASLTAPDNAGTYDLVYMTRGDKILARETFTVK